eukprot:2535987-Karenia_brevis.AAC.1
MHRFRSKACKRALPGHASQSPQGGCSRATESMVGLFGRLTAKSCGQSSPERRKRGPGGRWLQPSSWHIGAA